MIKVLFDADIPERSRTRKRQFEIPWEPELTIAKFLKREGFGPSERASMLAAVNGEHTDMDRPLRDGDELMVTMAIQGGAPAAPARAGLDIG